MPSLSGPGAFCAKGFSRIIFPYLIGSARLSMWNISSDVVYLYGVDASDEVIEIPIFLRLVLLLCPLLNRSYRSEVGT